MNLHKRLKLLNNEQEWRSYRCGFQYSDVSCDHTGEPKEFPCYVYTNDFDDRGWKAHHYFLYKKHIEKLFCKIFEEDLLKPALPIREILYQKILARSEAIKSGDAE